jgi:serine protease Do
LGGEVEKNAGFLYPGIKKGGLGMKNSGKWSSKIVLLSLAILLVGFAAWACSSADKAAPADRTAVAAAPVDQSGQQLITELSRAFEQAAATVSPSVVPIYAESVVKVPGMTGLPDDALRQFFGDDFFKRFFGQAPAQKQIQRSLGSGVIVSKDGFILTNNHVVSGAQKLTVILGDKKTYPAKVVGTDPQSDVAVIRIDASGLPVATLGSSADVKVGEWVIAVGNPFALLHTVTHGIISAKGRSSVENSAYEDFLQTDAPINPGNSGGALADLDGNVIGINTAIASPSGGNVGLGFAIPIDMAKSVMEQLIAKGKVSRGFLGLTPQDIDQDLAKALKLSSTSGVLISEVVPGSPADRGGIKAGDVIIAFNGTKVEDSNQFRRLVAQAGPGSTAAVTVLRDGQTTDLKVTLTERPSETGAKAAPEKESPEPKPSSKLGLTVQTLTPDIAQQLGYKRSETGVVISEVAPASAADEAGLQSGDVIKEVNRVRVQTVEQFEREVGGFKSGDAVALLVKRGGVTVFVAITIP